MAGPHEITPGVFTRSDHHDEERDQRHQPERCP
jgi:hypothetical protein